MMERGRKACAMQATTKVVVPAASSTTRPLCRALPLCLLSTPYHTANPHPTLTQPSPTSPRKSSEIAPPPADAPPSSPPPPPKPLAVAAAASLAPKSPPGAEGVCVGAALGCMASHSMHSMDHKWNVIHTELISNMVTLTPPPSTPP